MKTYVNPPTHQWELICQRPKIEDLKLDNICSEVFESVKAEGDSALLSYTKRFDGVDIDTICLTTQKLKTMARKTPKPLRDAIDVAYANIQKFHKSQILDGNTRKIETMPGVMCWRESRPIERVGLYIPGGTAPLISTVLMLGIPAQISGCNEVIMCSPPAQNGSVSPAICYAAQKLGITKIACIGGIQAIAALAIGTDTIPKVDKIFGPGNQYVTAAKQYAQNSGVAIDMPAGPSEVMVVADESANPAFVAADLLSQAEHGTDSQVILVATTVEVMQAVRDQVNLQILSLPRKDIAKEALNNSRCIVLYDLSDAIEFANFYAPEHIILCVRQAKNWSRMVTNAGSVFLGNYSPESAGDYASGTNHTLPTGGWAKTYSGLSVDDFCKKVLFQTINKKGLCNLASTIVEIAQAEQLEAHARAITIRINNI